ncbi:RelA/SpoT family protein [Thermochromatium tepidum]|jgi:(p)ppGpp synthetase, RelA/SpoT family|uniref:GTP pyrophosphokinase n=1 Tax=Thermochromatium tepidum ATCC 43061 TaxID=316276 RepID=A0A6I6DX88_THETI|nr:bifunctional (p)ppGpp synthetase/guanosine-3',5'-bis(diphosphate) 3'-pyrophosphohydrolase [Thermochromatium tepidum]QGU32171.1 RelA/SpoT family protein [Thermochromatium tepidum ATCC 43061]
MVKPVYNLPEPHTDDAQAIRHWLDSLGDQYPSKERDCLARACAALARQQGVRPDSGESLIRHGLATADILARLRMDHETLVAALLKGCFRSGEPTEAVLSADFGPGIARMVEDLVRIDQFAGVEAVIPDKDRPQHEENLRRLLLGLAADVRVMLIVLAERVHLMRAVKDLDPERRVKLARDTQRVYAPLANRLGIWQIKWELEDLSLRYLQPEDYRRIATLLAERREERERDIAAVIAILRAKFTEVGIPAEITGRPKHIYSIWKKMQRKNVDIAEIFDLRAVRILVDSVADCYAALGVVHGLWRHIPKEFDDYIATPKGNFYQSLHTAVEGPEGKALEVQIRTHAMHQHAEFGVAAHWAYKEARGHDAEFQRWIVWMRQWLSSKNDDETSAERLKRFQAEFEPTHIYVLTPQSKVIELLRGATPLDFAYAIHSELGHRCRGAKVNDRIVPLNYTLHSGDTVEILTQKTAAPSRDWLSPHHGYLITARARNRVRQWFKQQDFDKHLHEGRGLLERELARLGISDKPPLDEIAQRFNFRRGDDLLAAIGRGDLAVGQVARQVGEPRVEGAKEREREPELKARPPRHPKTGEGSDVVIEGVKDLMTRMASCCKPVPDDPIVGFVTRGRGVTVHRRDCPNIRHLSTEERARLIEVHWADRADGSAQYPVDLLVVAADRKGLLRDVSSVFADADVAVIGVETHSEKSTATATMRFTIEVADKGQLARLMTKLQQLPEIHQVRRFH